MDEPNITPWRRAVCGDLTSAFDFESSSSRVPPVEGLVAGYKPPDADRHDSYVPTPPAVGSVPTQEPEYGRRAGSATASTSDSRRPRRRST